MRALPIREQGFGEVLCCVRDHARDPMRSLWEKEVLLVRGTFEFPKLRPGHLYRIRVGTRDTHIQGPDGPLPIIPGMTASVEVLTGRKSVLEYLLKPVLKVRDAALRER